MVLQVRRQFPGHERAPTCQAAANGERRPRSSPSVIREEKLAVYEGGDPADSFTKSLTSFVLVALDTGVDQRLVTLFSEAEEQLFAI